MQNTILPIMNLNMDMDSENIVEGGEESMVYIQPNQDYISVWVDDFNGTSSGDNFGVNSSENTSQLSDGMVLPPDMVFNDGHLLSIVGYSILFILSAIGNITLLIVILRRRNKNSPYTRIDFMLFHLAIADLIVTFFMMTLEISWASTVSWMGGDVLCRVTAFFRIYGLYLSSFVLVCMAIDRYMAVAYPMQIFGSVRRGKIMMVIAWVLASICSFPQLFIFHVESHPAFKWYEQCVSFNSFPSPEYQMLYLIICMLMMYALPFFIIMIAYAAILYELRKRTSTEDDGLRRSGLGNLGRARAKTLKMSCIICLVFFVCWTPYYIMCLWYWIAPETAKHVDFRIQKILFLFASTNSMANPVIFGVFENTSFFSSKSRNIRHNRSNHESFHSSSPGCIMQTQITNGNGNGHGHHGTQQIISLSKPIRNEVRLVAKFNSKSSKKSTNNSTYC